MHSVDIQARLKKKGLNQADIARKLSVSNNAVSLVIRQNMISHRIMRAISEAIGVEESRIFRKHYARKAKAAAKQV